MSQPHHDPEPTLFDILLIVVLIVVVLVVFAVFLNTMAEEFAAAVLRSLCLCNVMR